MFTMRPDSCWRINGRTAFVMRITPNTQEQILLFHILGGVYYRTLGEYRDNAFPYPPVLLDPAITSPGGPLDRFRNSLASTQSVIRQRNVGRTRPYEYLLPSRIPSSTNI